MTCWEGERAASTSSPMALTLMFSMSCLTTLKLTSASSSAMRISRRALSMFSAESLPSPRRFLKTRCSFSDRLSNMKNQTPATRAARGGFSDFFIIAGKRNARSRRRRRRRRDADAAGGHLAGAVHTQFIENAGARPQVGGEAFYQAGDVEEDISSAIIRTEEAKTFGFEVSDYGPGLFTGGRFPAGLA